MHRTTKELLRINSNAIKLAQLLVLTILNISVSHSKLTINEIMSKNVSYQMYHLDNIYGFAGWVELHNEGIDSIDVKGYQFSDHEGHSWKCDNSIIIAPDSFYVFWFSEQNKNNHTDFKLDPEGGVLTIKNSKNEIVDELEYPEGVRNHSYGCVDNGTKKSFLIHPSLKTSNQGIPAISRIISKPTFSINAGFYSEPIKLELLAEDSCDIYYTLDGTEPSISDSLYSTPLELNESTVVKAIAAKKNVITQDSINNDTFYVKSIPATSSYFIKERNINLPVVSLSTNNCYLYDPEYGIYVVGNGRYPQKYSGWTELPHANYWGDEKRPLNIEFFDTSKVQQINQEIGVGIFGGYSRSFDKKSLKLNPSKIYGDNQFRYPLFESKFNLKMKGILLRSSGQDYSHSYLRDAFVHTLVEKSIDIDMQAYTPTVVYLNGSYFGLMNLRERHNEDYIYSNYGLDEESATQSISKSSKFTNLKKLDINSDTANTLIDSIFDINEIMNFTLTQIYCANTDWGGNNVTFWSRLDNEYWRVILYDTDECFSNYGDKANLNTISYAYKNSTVKFLLGNHRITNSLLSKFIVHLATTFSPNRVEHILDSLSYKIKDEALYYQEYRKKIGAPVSNWENEIKKMHSFAQVRPSNVFAHLQSYYSLGDTASLNIHSEVDGVEFIFNEEIIPTSKFNSKCFEGFNISLAPITPDGYVFDYWKVTKADTSFISYDMELIDSFHTMTSYEAVFKDDSTWNPNKLNLYLNELCITNKMYVDENRDADDWIELYNAGNTPINIGGMYISDARNNLTKWQIPENNQAKTTIPAKGFLMLWADGEPNEGVLHTNFSLSASKKQTVTLSRMVEDTIQVIDSVRYELHQKGESYARFSYNDFGSWTKTKWLTFNAPNRLLGYEISHQITEPDTLENIVTDSLENITFVKDIKAVENVLAYPNPAIDEIHFVTPWTYKTLLRIYKEERLCMVKYIQSGDHVDVSTLASGVYIAKLRNVKNSVEQKLLFIKK